MGVKRTLAYQVNTDYVFDKTFSGTDIKAVLYMRDGSPRILGEIQTISFSIHRDKVPVRSLGHTYAKGYTRGPRTIAGSIIFTVFNTAVLRDYFSKSIQSKNDSSTTTRGYSTSHNNKITALKLNLKKLQNELNLEILKNSDNRNLAENIEYRIGRLKYEIDEIKKKIEDAQAGLNYTLNHYNNINQVKSTPKYGSLSEFFEAEKATTDRKVQTYKSRISIKNKKIQKLTSRLSSLTTLSSATQQKIKKLEEQIKKEEAAAAGYLSLITKPTDTTLKTTITPESAKDDLSDKQTTILSDQLPPFDIIITFTNEEGYSSKLVLYGIDIVDEGQVQSIEDMIVENTVSFVARDIDLMQPLPTTNLDISAGITRYNPLTEILPGKAEGSEKSHVIDTKKIELTVNERFQTHNEVSSVI